MILFHLCRCFVVFCGIKEDMFFWKIFGTNIFFGPQNMLFDMGVFKLSNGQTVMRFTIDPRILC